ncbi:MAG: hypothetical protein CMD83_04780 [Gammaproteobacteria bacterium]|nr:hypothetical protein [Gammaproteobacteria bacterium]
MLITNPTAHSQSLPRAPTPAPTRGPEQVTRAAPVPPVLPVLLAVVTGRGTEAGTWRLEPLNLARSPAPAAEALLGRGVPQDAHSRTQTPVDPLQQRAVPGVPPGRSDPRGSEPAARWLTPGAEPRAPAANGPRIRDRSPIVLRSGPPLAPGILVPLEAHTDGWRVADRSLTPNSLMTMLRPMLGTPSATLGALASHLFPAEMAPVPPLAAMTPGVLRQLPTDTGAALKLLASLIRLSPNGALSRPTSLEVRAEKLIADRILALHLLSALISRGFADGESWLMETPVRVDDRLELLQLQVSHTHKERVEEDEWGPDVTAPIEEADEWQMRLLFNLDPLGSFGAWLRWNEQDGLSVDCWIESRRCFHIASKLEDQLHETLDRIGIKRLALHGGAMPQPSLAVPGGSNVKVTV